MATEIFVPVTERVQTPTPNQPTQYASVLTFFRFPIVSLGLGLHVTLVPTIRGGPVNSSNNNEGYYLDSAEEVFAEPQETAMEIAKRKNCATPNSIVEHFKLELEAQWERTTRTGEENGSLIFWERATNSYPRISLSEGKHLRYGTTQYAPVIPTMPEIGPETRRAIEFFSKEGRTVDFLAFFHTHPNYPGGDSRSGKPSEDGDIPYQRQHKNVLGIIRTGKGYSFFSNGKTFGPNDTKANDCIVDLNKSRN